MSTITKNALKASLKKLLETKALNKITVADITDDCGISRMTFYYHFKDIYDLVDWICYEDTAKALKGNKTYDTWQEGFLNIFKAVRDNKTFVQNVYNSISREQIENYLYKMTFKLLEDVVEEKAIGKSILKEDKYFIANFYKYAFVGLMLEWIKDDMKKDPNEIIAKLSIIVQGNINRAIERLMICKD